MNKTAKILKATYHKEELELIHDFFRASTATSLETIHQEILNFAFNILYAENNVSFVSLKQAVMVLDSLSLKQFTEAKSAFGIKVKDGLDLNRIFFPLRNKYLKITNSKKSNLLYFINKGKLYDLECSMVEGNHAKMFICKDKSYIEKSFIIEKDYIYLE